MEETVIEPRRSLAALALALAAACAAPATPADLPPRPAGAEVEARRVFRLGPNDIVRVGVHGHPELSTPASQKFDGTRVDPDGLLSLPLVGTVRVAGLTLSEARETVSEACAVYLQEPRVDLSVLEYAARRFYLFGEVQQPGPYELDRPLTIYQALTFGGGFKATADRTRLVLLREEEGRTRVQVIDAETFEAAGLEDVRPDDFLYVMRSGTGRFSEEVLPILAGISSSLSSVATLLLIEDRVD